MNPVVQITLKDGLMLPSGFIAPASYSCVIYCRVSPGSLEGDQAKRTTLELVLEKLYGVQWRAGNEDGSRYVIQVIAVRVLTQAEEQTAPWRGLGNNQEYHYWFYHESPSGDLENVAASVF